MLGSKREKELKMGLNKKKIRKRRNGGDRGGDGSEWRWGMLKKEVVRGVLSREEKKTRATGKAQPCTSTRKREFNKWKTFT